MWRMPGGRGRRALAKGRRAAAQFLPHVLITGGAGFIGSHLAERLLADGKSVVVLDDLSTGSRDNLRLAFEHPHFRFVESKISTCAELAELVAGAESIYHLAAAVG